MTEPIQYAPLAKQRQKVGDERCFEIVPDSYASARGFTCDAKCIIRKVVQKAPRKSDVVEILDQKV